MKGRSLDRPPTGRHDRGVTEARKLRYADLASLPDDGRRHELYEGELVVTPSHETPHQVLLRNLCVPLYLFVKQHGLGTVLFAPLDVIFTDDTVLEPDLLFISRARLAQLGRRGMEAAPDLVVEILSPSTARRDLTRKRALYAKHRVPEYWIVDPDDETLDRYQLSGDEFVLQAHLGRTDTLTSPLFPGFSLALEEIFE